MKGWPVEVCMLALQPVEVAGEEVVVRVHSWHAVNLHTERHCISTQDILIRSIGLVKDSIIDLQASSEEPLFRIRILGFRIFVRIRILPSTSKTMKKNLDFYRVVTYLWLFIFEEWCKCCFKKE